MWYGFGPLAPDLDPRLNDGVMRVADGVYPTSDGYGPAGQWTQAFTALAAAPKGGGSFVSDTGHAVIIAGTSTNLYRAYSTGWSSIGAGYSLQGGQRWRFAQFGGLAVATNSADAMQKINLDTLAVSALEGSPPKFEALAVVGKGFLVGTVMNGDVLTLAWSGAFNAESWTFGYSQSDYQTLPTGGRINGILGGEYGIILQRSRIVRMDYVGGNSIFTFNEMSSNIGCVTVHSVAQWGNLGFFLSDEGFMMWNGVEPVPIGREQIDAEFRAAYDVGDWQNMSTAIDPVRGIVMWSMGDKIYCYSWLLKKWSTITLVAPIIFSGVTKGTTLDETDASVGVNDDNLDYSGLVSFDSASFAGGDPRLYLFNSSYALGTLTGTPMAATLTGSDVEVFTGKRADARFVRPDVDATSGLTVTLAAKQRLGDATASTSTTTLQTSGDMALRASGRYFRPTVALAAGTTWTHAKGLEIVAQPGAGR